MKTVSIPKHSFASSQVLPRCNAIRPIERYDIFTFTAQTNSRSLHSSRPSKHNVAIPSLLQNTSGPARDVHATLSLPVSNKEADTVKSPLSNLPLSQLIRTYLITTISSSPRVFDASSDLLRRMIASNNLITDVEKNPVLRAILWSTFYKQFCAGETPAQVSASANELRGQGYAGVVLEYAREVLKDTDGNELEDVQSWKTGVLKSIELANEGDFVALKWSGMGAAALRRLTKKQEPSVEMREAMLTACQAAKDKGVGLLPSAEETSTLDGYSAWTLDLQRLFNTDGKAVMYNTYQLYLRDMPASISKHLAIAKNEGFTLGVKLVRGAYLGSEERNLIHPTIEATHAAFDGVTSALIHRQYNDVLQPQSSTDMPQINVVLATHNAESVRKATEARKIQAGLGQERIPLCFAQLQGMADEVSCALLSKNAEQSMENSPTERVLKYTSWGSMKECLNYLLRRAAENKDAAGRTAHTRAAMADEIRLRTKAAFGMA